MSIICSYFILHELKNVCLTFALQTFTGNHEAETQQLVCSASYITTYHLIFVQFPK